MSLKVLIPVVFCLLYVGQSQAQRRRNIYFFKNSGREVNVRDSADFVRVVSEPDSGSVLYNVMDIYPNKKPKLIGKSSRVAPISLEGQCVTYYPSGHKQQVVTYQQGNMIGNEYNYYPNGKLYTHKQHIPGSVNNGNRFGKVIIIDCLDSTGKVLAAEGNGYYIGYDLDFKKINEEGNLKSGVKDGTWKGGYDETARKLSFTETYDNGKFISGKATDENGTYTYTVQEAQPQYNGGQEAFIRYLSSNIRYPYYARLNRIQGQVICQFVVERDGSLTEIKAVRSPNDDLSKEALRVLKLSPVWMPGIQYGRPVRVMYTVPIVFSLNSQ